MDAGRATYDALIRLRLTCFKRDGTDTAETMRIRQRRYSAGIFNTFNQNSRLGGTDDAIKVAAVTSIDWDDDQGDEEDSLTKVQVTATAEVKCEETYA